MKNLNIHEPCTENWNAMATTEKGAFCQKCAKQVIDFTSKSNAEIKATFMEMTGQSVCGKIGKLQLDAFNASETREWQMNTSRGFQRAMVFSLVVVFGLSLFSCSSDKDKKLITKMQHSVAQTLNQQEPVIQITPEKTAEAKIIVPEIVEPIEEIVYGYDSVFNVIEKRAEVPEINDDYHILGGMSYQQINIPTILPIIKETIEYDENGIAIPEEFTSKAYPNPAVTSTTIEIGLPEKEFVEIDLYDLGGKLIQPVFSGKLKRGTHSYLVDMNNLAPGMYLFTIRSRKYSETVRVLKN